MPAARAYAQRNWRSSKRSSGGETATAAACCVLLYYSPIEQNFPTTRCRRIEVTLAYLCNRTRAISIYKQLIVSVSGGSLARNNISKFSISNSPRLIVFFFIFNFVCVRSRQRPSRDWSTHMCAEKQALKFKSKQNTYVGGVQQRMRFFLQCVRAFCCLYFKLY